MATTREKLVLSAVLALAFACRLDKLIESPGPPGLGVAPSRVAESADSGSGEVRPPALTVSSSPSRPITWTAHREAASAWLRLTDSSGATPATLEFTLEPGTRPPGTYRDAIIIVPDSAAPSVRVPVELRIARIPPSTGSLSVRVTTTGNMPDPDGYTVSVDGGQPDPVGVTDTTTYPGLAPGSHNVVLDGLASNCSVSGAGASRNVAVTAGQTATVTFAVNCPTPAPTSGDLTVIASTSGGTPDPDGYSVAVTGGQNHHIGANDSTTFTLAAGSYTVTLGDIAANCTVSGGPSRSGVSVTAGNRTRVAFAVDCPTPPPPTGNLTVTASTTGSNLDPDGYTITVDGGSPQAIGINASVSYTSLTATNHTVAISGVAANCTVSGATSQTVSVPSGGTATTTFTVSCSATTGNLTVSTSTSGSSLDPDGYTITVDGGSPQSVGINGSVSYTNLAATNHAVAISGVAANCSVSGATSQTVSVPSGGTATTTFTVTCATPPGNLTASASTSGSSLDPDGYTVAVDGGTGQALAINGSVTFTSLTAGNHSVQLSGVAGNCTVSGSNPRTVSVPSGSTATTTFTVTCATPPGDLTVSTSTTGSSLDPDGYTITVDGGSPQAIGINGNVSYPGLTAGSHTVAIAGVAGTCSVSGAPSRTVSVPSGGTATTTFTITCSTPVGDLTVATNTSGSSLDPDGYTITVDGGSPQAIGINGTVSYPGLTAGSHTVAIAGVAGTCSVSGAPSRTVSVPSGGTATTTFTITCTTPPPPTGDLTVTVSTTGGTLDPDGYTVTVDGGDSRGLGINETTTYAGLAAGSHSVQLNGLASNCSVSNNPRSVNVPTGGTGSTTFNVSCSDPPPPPNQAPTVNAGPDRTALLAVLFSLGASFSDPDNGPWSYTIEWGDGSSSSGNASSPGGIGGTHTFIVPGSYRIRVTVRDSSGGTGSDEMTLTVIL